jgi:hypothetical protein
MKSLECSKVHKKGDKYSPTEFWEIMKRHFTNPFPSLTEDQEKALKESLSRAEEDSKAGRVYSSEKFWAEMDRRRKHRA